MICEINSHMNDLTNIQLFVRVVEEGSFSAAARAFGNTPSSVSKQISQLERDLNARLFNRTTRKQSLTEAGEVYFQHVRQIVADVKEARHAVNKLTDAPSGNLQITTEPDFAAINIAPILPEFMNLYPEINVRITMDTNKVDILQKGIDLAIRIGHPKDSSHIVRKITTSQSLICASPTYLKKHGTPTHPNDLISHNCLSYRTAPGKKTWNFSSNNKQLDVPISSTINANSILFLRSMALADMGIVTIPKWIIRDQVKNKELVPILSEYKMVPESTPINAIYPNKTYLAPKVRVFIDFLCEKLKKI